MIELFLCHAKYLAHLGLQDTVFNQNKKISSGNIFKSKSKTSVITPCTHIHNINILTYVYG